MSLLPEAFYLPRGDNVFEPTIHTVGPWSRDHQHGGPPSALLGRVLSREARRTLECVPTRITVEFLRPLVVAPLTVEVSVMRPGRSALTLVASLHTGGKEIARALGLFVRTDEVALPPHLAGEESGPDVPDPETVERFFFPFFKQEIGYHTAVDLRVVGGEFGKGPTTSWMRTLYPIVPDEEPGLLERVLLVADCGNGLSPVLDFEDYTFINPDLTVYFDRLPRGPWIGLDACTRVRRSGTGLAESRLFDPGSWFGRAFQSLIVARRGL